MGNQRLKRITGQVIGWVFIFLGILGLFLPVLQGFLFLILGLLILSKTTPWAKKLLDKLETRFPKVGKAMEKLRKHPRLKRFIP
ncbi:hypothetical protein GCM10011571_15690 [Marinithermofilum abyssi]|uniref:Transmembrane protein (PGPGW) n=1 Tax=Marinithermofilum abyssi TaxID=1571185 RepID=A0A8J2VG96_9BACL|nr:PGPGW domain-containing protein [Marinithermofilum abyssi]GGE15026.1 hypothetical protein GCM10011571_15690 [Marinithermofilum abyssi]